MEKRRFIALVAGIGLMVALLALPLMTACKAEVPTVPTAPTVPTGPTAPTAPTAVKPIVWKANIYGASRMFTWPFEWFVDEWTKRAQAKGYNFKIDKYFGAVLAPEKKMHYGVRDGLFEVGFDNPLDEFVLGGFASNTSYLLPEDGKANQVRFMLEYYKHPLIIQEYRKFNCMPGIPQPVTGKV